MRAKVRNHREVEAGGQSSLVDASLLGPDERADVFPPKLRRAKDALRFEAVRLRYLVTSERNGESVRYSIAPLNLCINYLKV